MGTIDKLQWYFVMTLIALFRRSGKQNRRIAALSHGEHALIPGSDHMIVLEIYIGSLASIELNGLIFVIEVTTQNDGAGNHIVAIGCQVNGSCNL